MLTNPSHLRHFLRSLDVFPKKRLSQNFLIDGNILNKLLDEAQIQAGDSVLEIGPGPGAITEALCARGAKVIAVEKDPIFAQALKRLEEVEGYAGDILEFDFSKLSPNTKVISNLPYHLTAPILSHLISHLALFSNIWVFVQDEVARRMIASPRSKEYSAFTLFINFYSKPRYAFKVNRSCFYPQPTVDSAVMHLDLAAPIPLVDEEGFFSFVRRAFQNRRKMLTTSLKNRELSALLIQIGENPRARPEDLSLEQFIRLYQLQKK